METLWSSFDRLTVVTLPTGLSFDDARSPVEPRAAATVIVLRERDGGLELYCVERHPKSGFLGGAVVFPGGKVDPSDGESAARDRSDGLPIRSLEVASTEDEACALAVAAARETLEEVGVVPAAVKAEVATELRRALGAGHSLASALTAQSVRLDLARLVTFARWITPEAEARRFDARFYLLELPEGQDAEHDGHETTRGFWATATDVLARFAEGAVQLAPPTTRTLEILAPARTFADAAAVAGAQSLLPVCPRFVPGDPPALALPGDPAHEIRQARLSGPSRFVLRDGRFVSEDPR